jgi:hypothetical protein
MQTLTTKRSSLKSVAVAAAVWAAVMAAFGLAGAGLDPLEHETALLWLVVFGGFLAALAGTVAGARTGGRVWAPALTVVVAGVLLTASGGGTSATDDDALLFAAFPIGALLGALASSTR